MNVPSSAALGGAPARAGRYTLHAEIASGGMATVYYGQMVGAHGFSRVVAIKRMLPRLARDPRFHAMFVDEARLASRVQHPNVVPILDVVDEDGEVMIVMEFVRGPSLSSLLDTQLRIGSRTPIPIVASIGCGMLAGLHAAHEARDRRGKSLGIVHRDVSPQNVLVGIDGIARLMDFGVAKATELGRADDGTLTGKLAYMAPEQFDGSGVDRRTDVFAAGVVLWSALAGRRLFRATSVMEAMQAVSSGRIPPLSDARDDVPPALESAIVRALEPDREQRHATAEAFAAAIEAAAPLASPRTVGDWVSKLAGTMVTERDAVIVQIEKTRTTMAISAGAASDSAELVRSDVLTNEWVRDSAGSPRAAPAAEPIAPAAARSSRLWPIAIGVSLTIGSIGAASSWLTRSEESAESRAPAVAPSETTIASAPAPTPTPTPTQIAAPSAEKQPAPDTRAEPDASATPHTKRKPVGDPSGTSTALPPKPAKASPGREDYYPDGP